ncbi:MAG: hypothetical protein IKN20_05415 [Firmicutes bacterium]|nr:hypothetical protein [Bacillota bacterium]
MKILLIYILIMGAGIALGYKTRFYPIAERATFSRKAVCSSFCFCWVTSWARTRKSPIP